MFKNGFIIFILISLLAISLRADEFDDLREKWKKTITGGTSYDTNEPLIASKILAITSEAQTLWSTMKKDAGRTELWAGFGVYKPIITYDNLLKMTLAYSTKGSTLEGDATLLADILSALEWGISHLYYQGVPEGDGDFISNEIIVPTRVNDMFVLLHGHIPSATFDHYMNTINYFTPNIMRKNKSYEEAGANRATKAKAIMIRAILVKDAVKLAYSRDVLSQLFDWVTTGNGFYEDGSFIQHEKHPYNGGYGVTLLYTLSNSIFFLHGSTWEVTDPDKVNVFEWVEKGYEPFMWQGNIMDMVRGRNPARATSEYGIGAFAMHGIMRLADATSPAQSLRFKRMLKYWIQKNTFENPYEEVSIEMIQLLRGVMADTSITTRGDLIRYRQFSNSDRATIYRPGYALGLSMNSSRIYNYEDINDHNKKGWHTSDGMTYLYNNDLTQYSEQYWSTVNMKRLAGTTISQNVQTGHRLLSSKTWVGGVEFNGLYGAAGMDYQPSGQSLRAKKSWFMFDDEIVAIGSGINSVDNNIVETIIENRKLNSTGNNSITINGITKSTSLGWSEIIPTADWVHLGGNVSGSSVGYYFPGGAKINALREMRTGKQSAVSSSNIAAGDPSYNKNYATFWFDHGSNPVEATYEYVLLPNKTMAETATYQGNPDVIILANNNNVHAVKENKLKIIAANFWSNSTQKVDLITCHQKASVMLQEVGKELVVSISDPTHKGGTIEIEIEKNGSATVSKDIEITIIQLSPTIKFNVNVSGKKGQSFKLKISLEDNVVPPVNKMNHLIGWWKMDGDLTDSSPTGLDGTLELFSGDLQTASFLSGVDGQAVDLAGGADDSNSAVIRIPDAAVWDTGSQLTVSHWFKTTKRSRQGTICHDEDKGEYSYIFYLDNLSGTSFYVSEEGGDSAYRANKANSGYDDGVWHHVVGVYDRSAVNGRVQLYFDGEKTSDVASDYDIRNGDKGITIGVFVGSKKYYFEGQIDDVAIFDKALTNEEIQQLFLKEKSPGNVANKNFKLTSTASDHGAISPEGEVSVIEGGDQLFTFTPDEGYRVANVTVDGISVGAKDSHLLKAVASDTVIHVTFELESVASYTIGSSAGLNGNIQPSGFVLVADGADQKFEFNADIGFEVSEIMIDGVSVSISSSYEFFNVLEDHVISVSFKKVSVSSIDEMNHLIGWWKMDGDLTDSSPTRLDGTLELFSGNLQSASFVTGVNGQAVDLAGGADDSDSAVIRIPDAAVWDTGSQLTVSHWFRTTKSSRQGTICHDEDKGEYSYIFYLDNLSGTSFYVSEEGGDSAYRANKANSGYDDGVWHHVVGVYDRSAVNGRVQLYFDGEKISDVASDYDIRNGDKGITIGVFVGSKKYYFEGQIDDVAIFDKALTTEEIQQLFLKEKSPGNVANKRFEITSTASDKGTVSPDGKVYVAEGGQQLFTFMPDEGYQVANVTVDGVSLGSKSSHLVSALDKDIIIHVDFELEAVVGYIIESSAGLNGNIQPNGVVLVADGANQKFEFNADVGFEVSEIIIDGVSISSSSSYEFFNVSGDHIVSVSFKEISVPAIDEMNHLIGWWKMDGDLSDSSPTGLDGTLELFSGGLQTASFVSGINGQAVDLAGGADDSNSAVIRIPDASVWDTGSQITVSHWFRTTKSSRQGTICHDEDKGEYSYLFYLDNLSGTSFFVSEEGGDNAYRAKKDNSGYDDGAWHHVVGVYDRSAVNGRVQLYFDGEKISDVASDYDISDGDKGITIGVYVGSKKYYFEGQIDDVAIFDKALTNEEIQQLYFKEKSPGNVSNKKFKFTSTASDQGVVTPDGTVLAESGEEVVTKDDVTTDAGGGCQYSYHSSSENQNGYLFLIVLMLSFSLFAKIKNRNYN